MQAIHVLFASVNIVMHCFCTVIFVIFLQSSIFAGSVILKTFTESYQMTYVILKHRIKENADVNSVITSPRNCFIKY